jgi:hypothetical protein
MGQVDMMSLCAAIISLSRLSARIRMTVQRVQSIDNTSRTTVLRHIVSTSAPGIIERGPVYKSIIFNCDFRCQLK